MSYIGDQRFSFNRWDPNISLHPSQFRDSNLGSSDSLYAEPCPSERDSARPPPVSSLPRPSLHYRVSPLATPPYVYSIECLYDTLGDSDGPHYDTASDYRSSQRDLPASPYEIPTPTVRVFLYNQHNYVLEYTRNTVGRVLSAAGFNNCE